MGGEQHGHLRTLPPAPADAGRRRSYPRAEPRRRSTAAPIRGRHAASRAAGSASTEEAAHEQDRHGAVGRDRLRVGPWRGDPTVAYIAPAAGPPPVGPGARRLPPDPGRHRGYTGVLTAALAPARAAGLPATTASRSTSTSTCCATPSTARSPVVPGTSRRGRRRDRDAALAVDHLAFEPFWRFDQAGLDDARRATPVVRGSGWSTARRDRRLRRHRAGRARSATSSDWPFAPTASAAASAPTWCSTRSTGPSATARSSILVNTQEHNHGALALYEQLGFVREPDGLDVLELPLAWPRSDHVIGGDPPPAHGGPHCRRARHRSWCDRLVRRRPRSRPARQTGSPLADDHLGSAGDLGRRRSPCCPSRPGSGPPGSSTCGSRRRWPPTRRSWPASTCRSAPRTS